MMSFRFTERRQKDVQLAIIRDLFMDHQEDQPAKTVLSNAIAVFEATPVAGDLDKLIADTDRWYRRQTRWLSVFFVALAAFEFAWGFVDYRHEGRILSMLGPWAFGLCLLFYCVALQGMWKQQRRYHTSLKWLDDMQLELSSVPPSLTAVN